MQKIHPRRKTEITAGPYKFFTCETIFTHKNWLTALGKHDHKQLFFSRAISFWFMALALNSSIIVKEVKLWCKMTNMGHVKYQHTPVTVSFWGAYFQEQAI